MFYSGLPMIWMGNLVFVFCFSLAWEGQEIGGSESVPLNIFFASSVEEPLELNNNIMWPS